MDEHHAADRFAIQDVMARYAAGVDERDFELYASLFADEVEVVGFSEHPIIGRRCWVEFVQQALTRYAATQHLLGPVHAEVEGDAARCRTDVQALHIMADAPDEVVMLWGTYRTDMQRVPGGWQIQRHELIRRGIRTL